MSELIRAVEECPYRVKLTARGDSRSACCDLLRQIMGVDRDSGLCDVSRDGCQACCDSFAPSLTDINSIVASLLYHACEHVIAQGGTTGCDREQATSLKNWAEQNLPVVSFDEDDIGNDTPSDAAGTADRALDELDSIARGQEWTGCAKVGSRRDDSTPAAGDLGGTLGSLVRAGWDNPRLFMDSAVGVPNVFKHFAVSLRVPLMGAWPSYFLALAELLMREPDADAFLLAQDDVAFFSAQNLRAYLERALWPGQSAGVVSLYCPRDYTQPQAGWHRFEGKWIWGATAFIFSREAACRFLSDPEVVSYRWNGLGNGTKGIDVLIGRWADRAQIPIHFPTPSLVQHTGHVSTLWENARAVGARRASQFAGASRSTEQFASQPKKFVILSTGRCGTSLLQAALDDHSRITMGGEIFNQDPAKIMFLDLIKQLYGCDISGERLTNTNREVISDSLYVDEVFKRVDGVSIHYWQLGERFSSIAHYLRARPDVRIVQLIRRSDLERYVSLEFAERSDVWHLRLDEAEPAQEPIQIDPQKFLSSARRARQDNRRSQDFFGPQLRPFFYEELATEWDTTTRRMQEFLEVPYEPLKQQFQKSITVSMSRLIENYQELKAACRDTEFESCFE